MLRGTVQRPDTGQTPPSATLTRLDPAGGHPRPRRHRSEIRPMPHARRRLPILFWALLFAVVGVLAGASMGAVTTASAQVIEVDIPERADQPGTPSPTPSASPTTPAEDMTGALPPTGGELLVPLLAAAVVAVIAGIVLVRVVRARRRAV
jgi:hypothetical protein